MIFIGVAVTHSPKIILNNIRSLPTFIYGDTQIQDYIKLS